MSNDVFNQFNLLLVRFLMPKLGKLSRTDKKKSLFFSFSVCVQIFKTIFYFYAILNKNYLI